MGLLMLMNLFSNLGKGDDPRSFVSRLNDSTPSFWNEPLVRVIRCRLQMLMIRDVALTSSGICDSDFNVNDGGGGGPGTSPSSVFSFPG